MLFFDDALDGKFGNVEPVAALGVLSVHTPDGFTRSAWQLGLRTFAEYRSAGRGSGAVISTALGVREVTPTGAPQRTSYSGSAAGMVAPTPATTPGTIPCFSMSQPFAALLLSGTKTLETRNGPMLAELEGQWCAVHVGRRDWPDDAGWRAVLTRAGVSEADQQRLSALPRDVQRGDIAGVVLLGPTVP
eukprot:EG_transcript_10853